MDPVKLFVEILLQKVSKTDLDFIYYLVDMSGALDYTYIATPNNDWNDRFWANI